MITISALIIICACTGDSKDVALMEIDFEWQPIDRGSRDNPEIKLTGVPEGTKRFLVSLVDLYVTGFDHGSGFADNDGTGVIARGAAKGSYGGPDPPWPTMKNKYEITVRALNANGDVIGIGKKAKVFLHGGGQ
jgi:phosphatidylethanolamine-binding protein (PEBP) family uncharacterized protein